MRRRVYITVLGTMLTALALPPAHAKGTAGGTVAAPVATAPTIQLGFHPTWVPAEVSPAAPETPLPPPARPRRAVELPPCHEVTSVGVVVERASACSPPPR